MQSIDPGAGFLDDTRPAVALLADVGIELGGRGAHGFDAGVGQIALHFGRGERGLKLAVQARDPSHLDSWTRATSIAPVVDKTNELIRFLGLTGMERAEAGELSYGGQRLLDMGLALRT